MKTIKVTTWLDPEEVERFLGFLSDLQEALRQEQNRQMDLDLDDPVPF